MRDTPDKRRCGECLGIFQQAHDELNKIRIPSAYTKTFTDGGDKVAGGPSDVLRALDHNTISGGEGGQYGR